MPVRAKPTPWLKFLVVAVGLGLLALVVHSVFGEGGHMDLKAREAEYEQLNQQVDDLEKENRRLTDEVKQLRSDPDAIERVAREQLKMARPGETVVTLPKESEKQEKPPGKK